MRSRASIASWAGVQLLNQSAVAREPGHQVEVQVIHRLPGRRAVGLEHTDAVRRQAVPEQSGQSCAVPEPFQRCPSMASPDIRSVMCAVGTTRM